MWKLAKHLYSTIPFTKNFKKFDLIGTTLSCQCNCVGVFYFLSVHFYTEILLPCKATNIRGGKDLLREDITELISWDITTPILFIFQLLSTRLFHINQGRYNFSEPTDVAISFSCVWFCHLFNSMVGEFLQTQSE